MQGSRVFSSVSVKPLEDWRYWSPILFSYERKDDLPEKLQRPGVFQMVQKDTAKSQEAPGKRVCRTTSSSN